MTDRERRIIKTALSAYDERVNGAIESASEIDVPHSQSYFDRITEIVKGVKQHTYKHACLKKKIIASIAAALVLLMSLLITACTVPTVRDFIIEFFDGFVRLRTDEDERAVEPCTVTYLPDGYEVESEAFIGAFYEFVASSDKYEIRIQEARLHNLSYDVDANDSNFEERYLGHLKIYTISKYEIRTVIWKTDEYAFTLTCPESLPWEEIEGIVLGIE